jgi:cytosine/adenosine deaminase-related metal-dependent hydrolase
VPCPGFLGAHPVYLSAQEVRRYGASGAAAAYCAVSNSAPGLGPPAGALPLLVYAAGPEAVRDVMVNGRWLLRARRLVHLDEAAVLGQAAAMQSRLARRAGLPPAPLVPEGWRLIE